MANWQHSQKRYDQISGLEYYLSKYFHHLIGQREVRQYPKHVYRLRVLREYALRDVALDEDPKVEPVRLHNLRRGVDWFYQKFDMPVHVLI